MSSDSPPADQPLNNSSHTNQRVPWTTWLAIVAGLAIILPGEYRRWREGGWVGWLSSMDWDTTPALFIFLLLPLAWFLRTRGNRKQRTPRTRLRTWFGANTKPHDQTSKAEILRAWVLASFVAVVSWMMSLHLGATPVTVTTPSTQYQTTLSELPPALHDEYSYLFQAKTFLAGRVAYPSHETCSELFDQIHVLNENGIYAGRYFPGTAVWMAPFVALGKPYWGHWLAGALSAAFVFHIGRELAGNGVGLVAGLLAALSPGILTFGQLLLAHHPTLVGLMFFAWMFLRMMRTRSFANASLAGAGLIFATLCRPMTAAGVGLPFGIWLAYWWIRGPRPIADAPTPQWNLKRRTLLLVSMAMPIGLGIGAMLIYNSLLTGNMLVTPYQLYTDLHTPRHVYGFNNVERAKASTSTKVIEKYDRWAENLTPALAIQNVKHRLTATGQWVSGLVPLAMSICVFPFLAGRAKSSPVLSDSRWWLILLAALSLHMAHIPYWFVGIRYWHYVFEAAPFLLVIQAGVTGYFLGHWWRLGHVGLSFWWTSLILAALWIGHGPLLEDWQASRVRSALHEDIWSRRNYAVFNDLLDRMITNRPALVLIAEDPTDRHIDYVTNDPALDAPIIRGRFRPELRPLEEIVASFPDRTLYVVVLNAQSLAKIEGGQFPSVRFEYLAEEPIVSGTAVVYRLSLPPREDN